MTRTSKSIATQRLRLLPVTAKNAEVLWTLMQTAELRTYQDLPTMERSQFVTLVAGYRKSVELEEPGRHEWLVQRVDGGEDIGWVSLRIGEATQERAELGYSLLQEFRGSGYATEAVRAVVEAAFATSKLRTVRAYCLPENERSRALLRRLGFHEDGRLKRGASVRGRAVDVICYSLARAA
ncbi:MAG: GNAT family N-acetyltransferase [Candidatus Tyrphobacter sp.]